EPRLRQRALGGVDEEDDAVDHGKAAIDLSAEVGVARGVDDIDDDGVLTGRGTIVEHRGVLREYGDVLLTFEASGIHDAIGVIAVFAEHTGLPEHGVDQGGLAVVDVCDDCYIAAVVPSCDGFSHQEPFEIERSVQPGPNRPLYAPPGP